MRTARHTEGRSPHPSGDRGAATAEVAVALPALLVVLALCLSGLVAAMVQVRAHDAAATAARLLGRGESPASAAEHVSRLLPGATMAHQLEAGLVCVRVEVEHRLIAVPLALSARSCTLDGGR